MPNNMIRNDGNGHKPHIFNFTSLNYRVLLLLFSPAPLRNLLPVGIPAAAQQGVGFTVVGAI